MRMKKEECRMFKRFLATLLDSTDCLHYFIHAFYKSI